MTRALNQLVPYLSPRRALQKSSLAESLWIKARMVRAPEGRTWKDKILDYEIETKRWTGFILSETLHLKR